jgi:ribosome maturation factor RimP
MTHPLIPSVLELASPIASQLHLEVVDAVFHTHQNPPILRVDIRNLSTDTGLDDCERMSHALETALDAASIIPEGYVLEVSSPGVSDTLSSDRDFRSFRGFPVLVTTQQPFQGNTQWIGNLVGRDDETVRVTQRGRVIAIPRATVAQVQLQSEA